MEKCLLVSYLWSQGKEQQARSLAQRIYLEGRTRNLDTDLRKRLYDTVISAQSKAPARKVELQSFTSADVRFTDVREEASMRSFAAVPSTAILCKSMQVNARMSKRM